MKNIAIIVGILMCLNLGAIASENANASNEAYMQDTWGKDKISNFIKDAANLSNREIQAGQLALQNSSSQQVKDLAQMLIQDHSSLIQKLKSVLSATQSTDDVPTSLDNDGQSKIDRLRNNTGSSFDKDYVDMLVKDHKDAIEDFEDAEQNVSDPGLKSWVTNALNMLRKHRDQAQSLKDMLK